MRFGLPVDLSPCIRQRPFDIAGHWQMAVLKILSSLKTNTGFIKTHKKISRFSKQAAYFLKYLISFIYPVFSAGLCQAHLKILLYINNLFHALLLI